MGLRLYSAPSWGFGLDLGWAWQFEGMVDEVWKKRWGSLIKNPSYVLAKKIMIWILDLLPSYKFFILFIRLEIINLTQSPTTFLYDVILYAFLFNAVVHIHISLLKVQVSCKHVLPNSEPLPPPNKQDKQGLRLPTHPMKCLYDTWRGIFLNISDILYLIQGSLKQYSVTCSYNMYIK